MCLSPPVIYDAAFYSQMPSFFIGHEIAAFVGGTHGLFHLSKNQLFDPIGSDQALTSISKRFNIKRIYLDTPGPV